MNRLHPHDLRALVAASIHGPIQEGTSVVVEATDHLIGHLDATARRLTSPGLEPPRPAGCPSCANAEAQVDRLKAALDLEAKARVAMAEGLAEAKVELDKLMGAFNLLLPILEEGADSGMVPRGGTIRALAHVKELLIGQHPGPDPAIRAEDLVEALDDDPEPRGGFHDGHDTFEEVDGER